MSAIEMQFVIFQSDNIQEMNNFSLAIHGGAGTLVKGMMTPDLEVQYRNALKVALDLGAGVLRDGGTAIDAVEMAVVSLEDSPLFNAGKGSVFTSKGLHEMDASIMDGRSLEAGGVSLVTGIKNPVKLAREVMDHSDHVFLAGDGAMEFADMRGVEIRDESYFFDKFRFEQWQEIKDSDSFQLDHSLKKDSKFGTVGAVACDRSGNLAAATSTGGMTNKRFGRIGDSPVIGSGTYANNATCAVSCTGSGEFFIRAVAAYDVSCLMEYKNYSLQQAADEVVHKRLKGINGDGGLIACDSRGNICMPFNTEGMYRAAIDKEGNETIAIYS